MTREEAIKIIDCYDIGFYDLSGEKIPADKLAEAFDMAIEALSAVPTHGRLIDADALKENMKIAVVKHICTNTLYNTIMAVIDGSPTVQADRPHGEWVEVVERTEQYDREGVKTWATLYQCSNCGFVLNAIEGHIGQHDFCPNCGADMRGGGANE